MCSLLVSTSLSIYRVKEKGRVMVPRATRRIAVPAAVFLMVLGGRMVARAEQTHRFDVNDISYLLPPPGNAAAVRDLIPADEKLDDGTELWPQDAFTQVLAAAHTVRVTPSAGPDGQIDFTSLEAAFMQRGTWKVVAFRADPAAPGTAHEVSAVFGAAPEIRIVLQPVTVQGGVVKVHDFTTHLVFDYVGEPLPPVSEGLPPRSVADKVAFGRILDDLQALKARATAAGISAAGPLNVHPALAANVPGFAAEVRTFLKRRLSGSKLRAASFMGVQGSEPWIFFAMAKQPRGMFVIPPLRTLRGPAAQMLTFKGGTAVMPLPSTLNVDATHGVSTSTLFESVAAATLDQPAVTGFAQPLKRDISDIVANPLKSNFFNTDCVSCHSESTRRRILNLPAGASGLRFSPAAGISGVADGVLPLGPWYVRNFGWFQRGSNVQPTATMRTANETAAAVEFIDLEYPVHNPQGAVGTSGRSPQMADAVANPLTLVMDIKSQQDFVALKTLLEQMQQLPPDKNPITVALNKLATVHFARFVFLSERQLAVITTYNGTFDDYIDSFVNAIGRVFDQLLAHVSNAPPLPVADHRQEFLAYVQKHDLKSVGQMYSAYPTLKVLDILTLQKQKGPQ
jgi:hypothetical protein